MSYSLTAFQTEIGSYTAIPETNSSGERSSIVKEGQIAVFVKGGQGARLFFRRQTHAQFTEHTRCFRAIVNAPFGGKTPFTAEVFFINRTAKLDMLWGTSDPISLIDPKYSVRLRVRAFGQFGIRISDFRVFLTELIGAVGHTARWSNTTSF